MEDIHKKGYCIFNNAFTITDNIIQDLQLQIKQKASPIFNSVRNDNKRIQCNIKVNSTNKSFLKEIQNKITSINSMLVPSSWVILFSKKQCQRQLAHLDYEYTDEFKEVLHEPNKVPLLVIVAVMPGTTIHLWENSLDVMRNTYSGPARPATQISLEVGDILIFRSDMIHAGSDYETENIRLHCYLDSPYVNRNKNRTWIIKKHANKNIQDVILE